MNIKQWSWQKKLAVAALLAVLFGAGFFGAFLLWGWKVMIHDALTPKVYTFSSAVELDKEQEDRFEGLLNVEIPKSAKNINISYGGGKDRLIFATLSLPSEDFHKFAEDFVEVPISEFRDGKTSKISPINKGPTISRKKHKRAPWWNLDDVKRSVYYEIVKEEKDEEGHIWAGQGRFIVIDLDMNRVYVCIWSS